MIPKTVHSHIKSSYMLIFLESYMYLCSGQEKAKLPQNFKCMVSIKHIMVHSNKYLLERRKNFVWTHMCWTRKGNI